MVWALFLAVNAYPLYLIIIYKLNYKLFQNTKYLGNILPASIVFLILYAVIVQIRESNKFEKERRTIEEERRNAGYIDNCTTFKIVNDSIYYKDQFFNAEKENFELINCHYAKDSKYVYRRSEILNLADPKSFEKINWQWSRDENYYFNRGKLMKEIDYDTFVILEANYSKDKNYVYFNDKIIEGAISKHFEVNPISHIGSDGVNNYKFGKLSNNN